MQGETNSICILSALFEKIVFIFQLEFNLTLILMSIFINIKWKIRVKLKKNEYNLSIFNIPYTWTTFKIYLKLPYVSNWDKCCDSSIWVRKYLRREWVLWSRNKKKIRKLSIMCSSSFSLQNNKYKTLNVTFFLYHWRNIETSLWQIGKIKKVVT